MADQNEEKNAEMNEEKVEEMKMSNIEKAGDKSCPQCGATLVYSPTRRKLYCQYCDYVEEIKKVHNDKVMEKPLDFDKIEDTVSYEWGQNKKLIVCESCGAEAIYDELDAAKVCPFCGANHVMELDGLKGVMPPDGVVPFKVGRKQAAELFKKWMGSKFFAPGKAKKQAEPDSFFGIYLPYWSFDSHTATQYKGMYGIDRTVQGKDGKTYVTTDWYNCSGNYNYFVDDELVIATTKHDKGILKSVEPFDTNNCLPYKPEYLSGFVAEKYSTGLKDAWGMGQQQIHSLLEALISDHIMRSHMASHAQIKSMSIDYLDPAYKYVVLPLWQSSFKFGGKEYHFMVNGETGKVGGKYPISVLKVILVIVIIVVIIALIYNYMG